MGIDVATTEAVGVFQGDLIVRTALAQALRDLRDNPSDLDVIWASLAQDALTANDEGYGVEQIRQAKEWFLASEIPVMINVRVPDNVRSGAFITVSIQKSDETMNTLGDSFWATETVDNDQPIFTTKFQPLSFDRVTGILELPSEALESPVMYGTGALEAAEVILRDGRSIAISEVTDTTTIVLENNGAALDLRDMRLRYAPGSFSMALEGMVTRDVYGIGCHSYHEPIHALFLANVVVYALTRCRAQYLESRGFQGSSISVGQLDVDPNFQSEPGYSRFINLTGLVHQVWAQRPVERVARVSSRLTIRDMGVTVVDVDIGSIDELSWIGDLDGIGLTVTSASAAAIAAVAPKTYHGVSSLSIATPGEIESELTFTSRPSRALTFEVNAGPGAFIYCALPMSFGAATFVIAGFPGGFIQVASGIAINGLLYRLYRSVNSGLGLTIVEVQ